MAVTALSGQRWQGSSVGIPNSFTPEGTFDVEYLVVAGGGGGASAIGANNEGHSSGAGGAGGYLANGTKDHEVTAQTYNITVGLGGAGGSGDESEAGTNGGNSIFDTETAIGGGGGGNSSGSPSAGATGKVGGSGGGGAAYESQAGGAGTSGQGYAGGAGIYGPNYGGGGGGGSASVGADADSSTGGNGGTGTSNDIQDDSSVIYAAGGGGGGSNPHDGGIGGSSSVGGDGWTPSSVATDGAVRTGSGGGGTVYGDAGSGSAGIVIIRFTTSGNSFSQVGGAETTVGSDTVITFTTAGTQDDKTTVTDVPVGSQFEETDTRKFYQASNSSTDSDGYGTVATDNSGETKNLVFDAGGAVVGDFTFRGTYTAVGGSTAWHGDASIWVADKDVAYKTSGSDDGVTGLCAVWKHESTGYDMWSRFTDFTDRTEIHRCVESGNPYTDCAGIFGNDGAGASFGTNINVEMARTGTTLTMKLYNSDWSSVTDTATRTSVISTKLRYFSFGGQHDGSITFTNSYSAITFDGVKWVERGTAI